MTTDAYRNPVRLASERDLARQKARDRREEARVLEAAGNSPAAAVLRAAARMYEDSVEYWEEELMLSQRPGAQGHPSPEQIPPAYEGARIDLPSSRLMNSPAARSTVRGM